MSDFFSDIMKNGALDSLTADQLDELILRAQAIRSEQQNDNPTLGTQKGIGRKEKALHQKKKEQQQQRQSQARRDNQRKRTLELQERFKAEGLAKQ